MQPCWSTTSPHVYGSFKLTITHLRWYLNQFYVNTVKDIAAAEQANLPVNKKGGTTINLRKKGQMGAWTLAKQLAGWPQ